MPLTSHRVDMVYVSQHIERLPDEVAFHTMLKQWRDQKRLNDADGPNHQSNAPIIVGGFARVRLDIPQRIALYANHQGGYYVRCPITGGNLAREFSNAVTAWRDGAPRMLQCPHCNQQHPLEDVSLAPPGAFAAGAVVFTDVETLDVGVGVEADLREVLGAHRLIIRRIG